MEFIADFFKNQVVLENVFMLIGVLGCFILSLVFNSNYNKGGSKVFIVLSRILIVLAGILVVIWIF